MVQVISYCALFLTLGFFVLFNLGMSQQTWVALETFSTKIASAQENITALPLTELYSKVAKSVVQIDVYDSKLGPLGLGSGFIYDTEGHVVTNQHVAEMPGTGALNYDIIFLDGSVYSAKFVGSDASSDLAVLRIENATGLSLTPLMLANSSTVRPGEQTAVIGSAQGLIGTLSSGIISAVGRSSPSGMFSTGVNPLTGMSNLGVEFEQPEMIQTDADINHGNSGGPAINMRGEVIGVSDLGLIEGGGLNFLIPSNTVKRIVPSLISSGTFKHPWLGVEGVDMTSSIAKILNLKDPKGFLVVTVDESSPAFKAGLLGGTSPTDIPREGRSVSLGGDIIVSADDKEIRNRHDLLLYLEDKNVGENLELSVIRDGIPQQVTVTLGERLSLKELS